jgi:hypothetical protein
MKRKTVLVGITLVLVILGSAGVLALLIKHEPDFYGRGAVAAGRERKKQSGKFMREFNQFCQEVKTREWGARFEERSINCFFDEHFIQSGLAERILPEGISEPRLAIEPDKLRLGFRYGKGTLSTIIAIDMRMWIAPRAANVVVLELQGVHAGAIPISGQSLLERLSEAAPQYNIDVTWYRHGGNPVALLCFQADQDRPTIKLEHLVLAQGVLEFNGKSLVTTARVAPGLPEGPGKALDKDE